jgi:aspartyl-tRNA(Asn)/glutamyl-tRNA(Gln) amidotransferase subunit A
MTAEARVAAALARISTLNPSLNAFITVFERAALTEARALDAERQSGRIRGPLHGLPISVKDLIDIEGVPTTAASRVLGEHPAKADAPVVTRLRAAGAVIIGKCNLHEFALGTTSDESAFGAARNPHDPDRSPGGSSGGSAIAVATGMSWASIGTDTGGSVRIPASACGVVGLKPGFGEISKAGVVPLSASLDHVGPLACNVSDAALVYGVLAGTAVSTESLTDVSSLRLGRLGGYFLEIVESQIGDRFEQALDHLRGAGASISDVSIPHASDIAPTYSTIVLAEAASFHANTLRSAPEKYSEGVRARLEMGLKISADDYVAAQRRRPILRDEVDAALSGCDALVLPTLPIPPPKIGDTTIVIASREHPIRPLTLRLTQLFNLSGHPAISLPCGVTDGGLPCGLQLVGRRGQTADLLRIALSCEAFVSRRTPWSG